MSWDGLFKIVRPQTALRHYELESSDAAGVNLVTAFLKDGAGTLWVGTEGGGLSRFDGSDGEWPPEGLLKPQRVICTCAAIHIA